MASEPEALIGFLLAQELAIGRVGLEAGPLSQWLHAGLVAAGFEAVLLETRHVKAALSAMTVKTIAVFSLVQRKLVPSTHMRWRMTAKVPVRRAALMTAATNQSFDAVMQRLVLDPTKMNSSTYAQPLDAEHAKSAAQGAGPDGTPMPVKWHAYPELAPAGLWTTPTDYARFIVALARTVRGDDHKLLSAASTRQLMTRGLGNWGLGVDLGPAEAPRQFGHTGANAGYQSAFIMYPDTCQGAVVMTNSDEGNWLMSEVMDAIGSAYGWPGQQAPAAQAAIPLTNDITRQFAGTYRLHDYPTEKFTISQKADGSLYWARVGHIGRDLLPQSRTRLFSPDSAMALELQSVSDGKAASLNLSFGGGVLNVADRVD